MKTRPAKSSRGVALIMVMIAITVLAVLAFGFAYSMTVETRLARNGNSEAELEWLGRSGVEYARWILSEQLRIPGEPYHALNQVWAGGPGGIATTNTPLLNVEKEVQLGRGSFTWKIVDLERRANINIANQMLIEQALTLMGADPGDMTPVVSSILDWIDPDDNIHPQGAETPYYQGLEPPYMAKNGPIDDLSELLLIKGITQELYWGDSATNHPAGVFLPKDNRMGLRGAARMFNSGLVDLFTPLSAGRINVNTASADVLQLIPGVDAIIAAAIVNAREGEDDGSGLVGPYRSVDQVRRVPEVTMEAARMIAQFCDVRSRTFEVQIDAQIGSYKRQFLAVLGCANPRDIQILSFYWK
jgi:general secretion pathway protein K